MKKAFLKVMLFVFSVGSFGQLYAHSLWTLRAELARAGGLNIDGLLRHTKQGHQRATEILTSLQYGCSEFITAEVRVPVKLESVIYEQSTEKSFKKSGLDKIHALGRFRVYSKYEQGKRNQILLIPGVFFPTVSSALTTEEKKPIIANRSMDFLIAAVGAFETLTWYHFAGVSYRINTRADQFRQGNQFSYSYAVGYRPIPPVLGKPDWVFLWELDGLWSGKNHGVCSKDNNSGGNIIFTGPAFFCSLDNVMIKGDIQFPMVEHYNGCQERFNYRAALGMFIQF